MTNQAPESNRHGQNPNTPPGTSADTNQDLTPRQQQALKQLIQSTLAELKQAQGDASKLHACVVQYLKSASAAQLTPEQQENIFGVNDASIMDLAKLSEADEELLIDAFETLTNPELD